MPGPVSSLAFSGGFGGAGLGLDLGTAAPVAEGYVLQNCVRNKYRSRTVEESRVALVQDLSTPLVYHNVGNGY